MIIQPVNNVVEHMINTSIGKKKKKKSSHCLFYKIKLKSVCVWVGGWGGGGALSQAVGRIRRSSMGV